MQRPNEVTQQLPVDLVAAQQPQSRNPNMLPIDKPRANYANLYGKTLTARPRSSLASQGNIARRYLCIQNRSNRPVLVNFGTSTEGNQGFEIGAGSFYEPAVVPLNDIYIGLLPGVVATARSLVTVIEGVN